jgi:site-specific DNA recombinase
MKIALYARVSSDLQTEKGTVASQLDFLRKYADLHQLDVFAEYTDESVTGPTPLADRPAGRRLLEDARARKFRRVIFYRVDRFARSTYELLDAERTLSELGVTLKSASEEFDTGTPMGRAIFQILGVLAELEKSTIAERTGLGRQRKAREGRWLGAIPFGYVIADGQLVPSDILVPAFGCTEADLVRQIFAWVADGETLYAVAQRLKDVPSLSRFSNGTVSIRSARWTAARVSTTVNAETYIGRHVWHSRAGDIERQVPPLIPRDVFDRAHRQLRQNLCRPHPKAQRFNVLRGLVRCKNCGSGYVCTQRQRGQAVYRCPRSVAPGGKQCNGAAVPAEKLEGAVWRIAQETAIWFDDMITAEVGEPLYITRDAELKRLESALATKEAARQDILQLVEDRLILYAAAKERIQSIISEENDIKAQIATIAAEVELNASYRKRWEDFKAKRTQYKLRLNAADDSLELRREIIAAVVAPIEVETTGEGRKKTFKLTYQLFDDEEIRGIPLGSLRKT